MRVEHFLNVILATHPELLHEAQKAALAQHAEILEAAELPSEINWPEHLPMSPRNVYGVMPAGLNTPSVTTVIEPVVEFKAVSVRRGAATLLDSVDWTVEEDEHHQTHRDEGGQL